jgi:lipoprotein-releasing system permease protein
MRYIFDLARRYLFGKKSTNAINLITGISVFGISIGAAALILVLSVFNGLETLITGYLNAFNPDLKILPVSGKQFSLDSIALEEIAKIPGLEKYSLSLEEVALFEYKGSQEVGIIKGVDSNYVAVTDIDKAMRTGVFEVNKGNGSNAVIGAGMAGKLGINYQDRLNPITIYMPKRKKTFRNEKDFRTVESFPIGEFSVQTENDFQYVISSFDFVNKLLQSKNRASAIEIKLSGDIREDELINQLKSIIGANFKIKNRYQQDETFLRIMNIERWVSYLIVSLTLLLVAFNLAGSLWMIVLDKKRDISILRAMGFTPGKVKNLFLMEGLLISVTGMIIGFVIALLIFGLQSSFGIVPIPEGFAIDAYPIELRFVDFIIVGLTVLAVGLLASILPANRASKVGAFIREE